MSSETSDVGFLILVTLIVLTLFSSIVGVIIFCKRKQQGFDLDRKKKQLGREKKKIAVFFSKDEKNLTEALDLLENEDNMCGIGAFHLVSLHDLLHEFCFLCVMKKKDSEDRNLRCKYFQNKVSDVVDCTR